MASVLTETSVDETTSTIPAKKAPPPPKELPLRFLRAGKNDPVEGQRRYEVTLAWRKENDIDNILTEPSPNYKFIKENYPHYYHFRGKNNEIVFYETPAHVNLKGLRTGGVDLTKLLRHYSMITEFQWQYLERDDMAKSIYICDLEGIKTRDFMGETVDFVKKAIGLSGEHYPERGGVILLINVPMWFKLIWTVIKPLIDKDTLEKIFILRGSKEINAKLQDKIDIDKLPPQFGGTSVPFGEAPEQKLLDDLISYNVRVAAGEVVNDPRFSDFVPVRSY